MTAAAATVAISLAALAVYGAVLACIWLFITHEEVASALDNTRRQRAYRHAQRGITNEN